MHEFGKCYLARLMLLCFFVPKASVQLVQLECSSPSPPPLHHALARRQAAKQKIYPVPGSKDFNLLLVQFALFHQVIFRVWGEV